jgi:hypothetical protein
MLKKIRYAKRLKARTNRLHLKQQPIICSRVSQPGQALWHNSQQSNLDDQMDRLEHAAYRLAGGRTAVYDYIGPGNDVERWIPAAQVARERSVPILAESLNRLMGFGRLCVVRI